MYTPAKPEFYYIKVEFKGGQNYTSFFFPDVCTLMISYVAFVLFLISPSARASGSLYSVFFFCISLIYSLKFLKIHYLIRCYYSKLHRPLIHLLFD